MPLILDNDRGQPGHADLLDQRLEIALEDLKGELLLGRPLPSGRHEEADGYSCGKKP